jgi:hypothetical protein
MCVSMFSTTFLSNISHSKKKWAWCDQTCIGVLVFVYSCWIGIFLVDFLKIIQLSNFMKIHPVEADLFQADRRRDMTKLTVTFHNFSNVPKNDWIIQINAFTDILNCYKIKQQWKLLSSRIHRTVFKCNQRPLL